MFVSLRAAGNARQLRALMAVAIKLLAFLRLDAELGAATAATEAMAPRSMSINDFLFAATLDNVNLFSLIRCESSIPSNLPRLVLVWLGL